MINGGVIRERMFATKPVGGAGDGAIFQASGSFSHTTTSITAGYSFGLSFFVVKFTHLILAWSLPLRVGKEIDLGASQSYEKYLHGTLRIGIMENWKRSLLAQRSN